MSAAASTTGRTRPALRIVPKTDTAPPRCPDELLASDLPDWAKLVWLAVRKRQGSNADAWGDYADYGDLCGKSYDMVRKAVSKLVKEGWMERVERLPGGRGYRLRCLWKREAEGGPTGNTIPAGEGDPPGMVFQPSGNDIPTQREQGSKSPTPPNKEEPGQNPDKNPAPLAQGSGGSDQARPPLPAHLDGSPHPSKVRAHEAPAVQVYSAWTGRDCPAVFQPALVGAVGSEPARLVRWAQICATWAGTHEDGGKRYTLSNVNGMIKHFRESLTAEPIKAAEAAALPAGFIAFEIQ